MLDAVARALQGLLAELGFAVDVLLRLADLLGLVDQLGQGADLALGHGSRVFQGAAQLRSFQPQAARVALQGLGERLHTGIGGCGVRVRGGTGL